MIRLQIAGTTFNEIGEWQRKLRIARRRLNDRREPHEEAKEYLIERWEENFQGQGSLYGDWEGLSEWSISERGSSNPILVRSGALWVSFRSQNEDGLVTNNLTQWEFQNDHGFAYPLSHHTGYDNPLPNRKPIPSRTLWDIKGEEEERIGEIFEEWLEDAFANI